MANEIKVSVRRQVTNGTFRRDFNPAIKQVDQAAVGEQGAIFNIGTSPESVGFTEIGTEGWLAMQNHDTANYVTFGPYSTDATAMIALGIMEAGEPALFRLDPAAVLYLKADTATCDVEISVLED